MTNQEIDMVISILNMSKNMGVTQKQNAFVIVQNLLNNSSIGLTQEEINAGVWNGKLSCVKMYKERVGKGLMDCKKDVETYFETNKLQFKKFD